MAKSAPIGLCNCAVCDFEAAEIKLSKNGFAYLWCPDCNTQVFTRTQQQHNHLLAKIKGAPSVPVTEVKAPIDDNAEPVTVAKNRGFNLRNL
jgi:hypothetical protein